MDEMDIDSILDVPDTPDRLIAQTNKGKRSMERGSNLSAVGHSGHCNRFVDDARNGHKAHDRGSRKLPIHASKSSSTKYDSRSNLAFASGNSSSSSSNNSLSFRRAPGETTSYESKHFQPTEDSTVQGNTRAEGNGKVSLSTSRLPFSSDISSSVITLRSANKGKEPANKASGFGCHDVTGSLTETQPKAGKVVPTSLNSLSSPRVTGQKRLVRNGCISPHNIAKAKQEVGMDKNGDIDVQCNHALPMVSSALGTGFDATKSISERIDSHKSKGKEIMFSHPFSIEESDDQSMRPRNSSIDEIVKDVGDTNSDRFGSFEELGGWRSTRNRSRKMNLPVSGEHQHLSSEKDDPCLVNRLPGVTRRKIGDGPGTGNNFSMGQDSTSSPGASLTPPRHGLFNLRPQLDLHNGHQAARNVLAKRQRHGSSSNRQGESSTAALGDSDIVFLGSSRDTSKSSSTQTRNRNGLGILEPIIEIDEASPEARGDGFSATGSSATATDALARQIEADEMLARELQEQFYNEVPSSVVGEDDVNMAMALQFEGSSRHPFPRRSPHVFSPRSSWMPSSTRQPQPRSSLNLSRRSSQARGSTSNRMARWRSRFPGRPRTISSSLSSSSRERNSLFPADMDVDMRMYILEALEAFSDMGVDNNFLQTHREFNENDYEMLLTLDENNHQHGGATDHQINGLPQSTVQSDNHEEVCAICLETPTIGDFIRHLPCLHKFHKDCIDPWLRRRTSCPVCKSSIT